MLQGEPWPWRHGHAIGGALAMEARACYRGNGGRHRHATGGALAIEARACYRGSPGHGGPGMLQGEPWPGGTGMLQPA